jgi:hypothetical protein
VHAQFGPVTQSIPRVTQQSCAAVDSDYLGTTRQEFGRVVPGPAADIDNLQPATSPASASWPVGVCVLGAGVGVLCETVADFLVVSGLCRHRDSITPVAADRERFVQPRVRPVNG